MLVSVFAMCQLVSGPLLGRASDRYGRKPLLLISQIGSLLGYILMANAHNLWMLYVARIIDGSTAGNISIAQAYISDRTPPEKRTKAFAVIGIAFGVGFFIGPFLTGYLANYGLAAPVWLAVGLSAASIVCTLVVLPKDGPKTAVAERAGFRSLLGRPAVMGILAQFFFYIFAFSTFLSGFALFAERAFFVNGRPFGPREVGYLFAFAGALGIILQGTVIGRLSKRFGDPALAAAGLVALVVGYALLAFTRTVPGLVAATVISSFGNGVSRPVLSSLLTQSAGAGEQGAAIGLNQSLNSCASIIAPIFAGLLIGRHLLTEWALVGSAAGFVGLLLVPFGSGRVKRAR